MPAVLIFAPIRGATEDEQQCYEALEFQPTCPVRGTTECLEKITQEINISTHVPRTGHDGLGSAGGQDNFHFNPRAPYGARRRHADIAVNPAAFQPTCPVRGTTRVCVSRISDTRISTHVPRTGHDPSMVAIWRGDENISTHVPRTGHDVVTMLCA